MDSFYNFSYKKNGKKMPVNEIAEINEELLLIYTDKELMLFDVVQQMFIATRLNPKLFTIVPNSVNQQGDNIYIGSDEGLFLIPFLKIRLLKSFLKSLRINR